LASRHGHCAPLVTRNPDFKETMMLVRDAMSGDVRVAEPNQTIREVARIMREIDAGVMPVGENDRLVGMITDRDIAVRAVAEGKGPDTKVREVMSAEVKYCYDDEELDEVTQNMADLQVRRLPVVNREKRLVGIIALGDVAEAEDAAQAGEALQGISRHGGRHSQSKH
jgi:CBS domain-containing protein